MWARTACEWGLQSIPDSATTPIMLVMTSPTADTLVRRIVLVPTGRDDRADAVRRYRFARLRLEGREVPYEARFSHLKRQYD